MDIVDKLQVKILSNKLPADQEMNARSLLEFTFTPRFLTELQNTDIIILPFRDVMTDYSSIVIDNLRLKGLIAPIPASKMMSFSTEEVSSFSARGFCHLLKEIFGLKLSKLKGVINLEIGVGVNGSMSPGPMLWMIALVPGLLIKCGTFSIVVSLSYCEAETETVKTEAKIIEKSINEVYVDGVALRKMVQYELEKADEKNGPNKISQIIKELVGRFPFSNKHCKLEPKSTPVTPIKNP